MRMGSVLGVIATLLAVGASTSVSGAGPDWPKSLTLATASPGGPYYVYGEALAQILTEKLGIPVNPLPTQGSIHNLKLLDSSGAQLALIVMGIGLQGWNGTGDWTSGNSFRNMRALFPMFDNTFQANVTIGVPNFAIGRADLPDDLVYQLVKAVFQNQPRLVKANSAARDALPQNVDKDTFLPFHPGAVRYYREIGVKIPDSLVPTN